MRSKQELVQQLTLAFSDNVATNVPAVYSKAYVTIQIVVG